MEHANTGEGPGGRKRADDAESGRPPDDASAGDPFAAVRADFEGLEEVCRWQWNLLQRLRSTLNRLPDRWPNDPRRP